MIRHLFQRNINKTGTGIEAEFFGTRLGTERNGTGIGAEFNNNNK